MFKNRLNRDINVFSMSALDLFASALGAFIIIAIIALPYYLKKNPDIVSTLEEVERKIRDEKQARNRTKKKLADERKQTAKIIKDTKDKEKKLLGVVKQISKYRPQDIDVVFVLDTTGSMRNQLEGLQKQIYAIVRVLERVSKSVHVGFVSYRDKPYAQVTMSYPVTKMDASGLASLKRFLFSLNLNKHPRNDIPEAVDQGMAVANRLSYRTKAKKFMIVIGDATAHPGRMQTCYQIARNFKARGNAQVSAIFVYTGAGSLKARPFFRRITEAGGGRLVNDKGGILESILLSIM